MQKDMLFSNTSSPYCITIEKFDNQFDKFAIKMLNVRETVGHLPCKYTRIAWNFLTCGGLIAVEVSSHWRHCKQHFGGMEILCRVAFNCSRKAMLKLLKALSMKKGLM